VGEVVFWLVLGAGVGSGLGCGGEIDDDDEGEDLGVSGAGAGAEVFRDCQGAVVAVRKLKTRGILGLGGLDRLGCSGVFLGAVSWLRRRDGWGSGVLISGADSGTFCRE